MLAVGDVIKLDNLDGVQLGEGVGLRQGGLYGVIDVEFEAGTGTVAYINAPDALGLFPIAPFELQHFTKVTHEEEIEC